jgi:hypothetical protein
LFCLFDSGFGQSNLKAGGQGFVQNRGQVLTTKGEPADNVLFQMGRPGVEVFILNDLGISFQFERHYSRKISLVAGLADVPVIDSTETFRVNMHLKNANLKAAVVLSDSSSDYINYYRPDLIRTRTFGIVLFKDVYPGIDWKIYSTEKGVKYDFIVHQEQIQETFKWCFPIKRNCISMKKEAWCKSVHWEPLKKISQFHFKMVHR